MKNLSNNNIFSKEEQEIAKDLLQTVNLNSTQNELTPFLTQVEKLVLEKVVSYNFTQKKLEFFGGTNSSERVRAKIIANDYYDIDYNIVCLRASFNKKFNDLKHRDVLGAVHNLGINYNRVGDIFIEEDTIFIFVDSKIADYVKANLGRIGRAVLDFEIVENIESITIEKQYDTFNIVSSSHRIDSIVSKITNKSRSVVKEMLQKEFVKLNHAVITSGEKNCKVGDMISVRRYGRFTIKEITQNQKSQKYRMTIDKLV